jgi:hypothetical protein
VHDAPLEVDVAPAQRAQLAEAQPGVGGGEDQRGRNGHAGRGAARTLTPGPDQGFHGRDRCPRARP